MDISTVLHIVTNILAFSTMFSNAHVVLVMLRFRKELFKLISTTYLFQQSIIDMFIGISIIISSGNVEFYGYRLPNLSKGKFFDEYLTCRFWIGEQYFYFFLVTSVFNMTFLTLERYIKIVHPLWYKVHISRRVVEISLAIPWFISMVYLLLFEVIFGDVTKDGQCNRPFFKVGGPMTNLLENVRKSRTKILVMLAANQMNEQPLENTFVPQDQDLGHWPSYLKKRLLLGSQTLQLL